MAKRGTAAMSEEVRSEVARKGGESVLRKYGREHFSRLGKMGGKACLEKYGIDHYSDIGMIGGSKIKHCTEDDDAGNVHPEKK